MSELPWPGGAIARPGRRRLLVLPNIEKARDWIARRKKFCFGWLLRDGTTDVFNSENPRPCQDTPRGRHYLCVEPGWKGQIWLTHYRKNLMSGNGDDAPPDAVRGAKVKFWFEEFARIA
jgi:hypothetical protein